MKQVKKIIAIVLVCALAVSTVTVVNTETAFAKTKVIKKKYTLDVGNKLQLKIDGKKRKLKYKSSNKKVATVTKKGLIKTKKPGKTTITFKFKKKKFKVKVKVKTTSAYKVAQACMKYGKKSKNSVEGTFYYIGQAYEIDNNNYYCSIHYSKTHNALLVNLLFGDDYAFVMTMSVTPRKSSTSEIAFNYEVGGFHGNGKISRRTYTVNISDSNIPSGFEDQVEEIGQNAAILTMRLFDKILAKYKVSTSRKGFGFN